MSREAIIQNLKDTMHETLRFYDMPAPLMKKSYGAGKWTLRQLLVHLSDAETVLLDRLRRLASEKKPVLMAFDENDWAKGLFYKQRDLNLARQQFETARRNIIELARALPRRIDKNVGTHSQAGTRTFGQILKMCASHNDHHLEQLRAIAAGKKWKPKKK